MATTNTTSFIAVIAAILCGAFTYILSAQAIATPLYFYPSEAWSIEQNASNCRITNTYNNGFTLSVVAKKNFPGAYPADLHIDFKQNAFTPATAYNATIQFDTPDPAITLDGNAINAHTLSIPISKHENLLRNLMNAPTVNILIGGNNFNFSLVGLKQHKDNFKTCLNASYTPPISAPIRETTPQPTQIIPSADRLPNVAPPSTKTSTPIAQSNPKSLIQPPKKKPSESYTMPISEWREKHTASSPSHDKPAPAPRARLNDDDPDWNFEKATMRYQEAERQLQILGQKLKKERNQCSMDKKELEALLFDPQLTSDRQIATLNNLEEQLRETQADMQNMERHYQERIRILEQQLRSF